MKKGFAIQSILTIGVLLGLLVAGVFIIQSRVGVAPRASTATSDPEDLIVAKESALGLKVTPTLGEGQGNFKLTISWNEKIKNEANFLRFRLAVRKDLMGSQELISDKVYTIEKTSPAEFVLKLGNLPNGENYYVQLKAIFKTPSGVKTVKEQRNELGYYSDGFEGKTLNGFWQWKRSSPLASLKVDEGFVSIVAAPYEGGKTDQYSLIGHALPTTMKARSFDAKIVLSHLADWGEGQVFISDGDLLSSQSKSIRFGLYSYMAGQTVFNSNISTFNAKQYCLGANLAPNLPFSTPITLRLGLAGGVYNFSANAQPIETKKLSSLPDKVGSFGLLSLGCAAGEYGSVTFDKFQMVWSR